MTAGRLSYYALLSSIPFAVHSHKNDHRAVWTQRFSKGD
jgi:hypothetical protein